MQAANRYWVFSGSAVIVLALAVLCLWPQHPDLAVENGPLENLQGTIFVLGGLWALGTLTLTRDVVRFTGWFYALFMATMVLREIDMDRIGLPNLVTQLTSGLGRDLLMGTLWVILLLLAIRYARRAREEILAALRSVWGRHLFAGVLFYLLAETFDKHLFPLSRETSLICEETLETLGALLFGYSTVLWSFLGTHRKQRSQ